MTNQPTSPREATRRLLDESNDPRVSRTRNAIIEGVHALIAEGGEISVANIVRASSVSRSGFYSHFASIDELATSVMAEAFATIASMESGARQSHPERRGDTLRQSLVELVDHYVQNRALYSAAATLPLSRDTHLEGVRFMANHIRRSIEQNADRPAFVNPDLAARFFAGAAFGLLDAWLRGELEATPEDLVEHLDRLTPDWYRATKD